MMKAILSLTSTIQYLARREETIYVVRYEPHQHVICLAILIMVKNELCQGPWHDALGLPWPTRHKHIHVQKKAPIT